MVLETKTELFQLEMYLMMVLETGDRDAASDGARDGGGNSSVGDAACIGKRGKCSLVRGIACEGDKNGGGGGGGGGCSLAEGVDGEVCDDVSESVSCSSTDSFEFVAKISNLKSCCRIDNGQLSFNTTFFCTIISDVAC
jgi:hypothetical protein